MKYKMKENFREKSLLNARLNWLNDEWPTDICLLLTCNMEFVFCFGPEKKNCLKEVLRIIYGIHIE